MLSSSELSRIFWLSGTPCGGKTSVAELLAKKHDWNVYHIDDHFEEHRLRATPENHANFYRISRLTGDALWLRPIAEQIATEQPFFDDEFDLIQEDLMKMLMQDSRPLIYDGFVSPKILNLMECLPHSAFYLVPTQKFQIENYQKRTSIQITLGKTSDPETAWNNWMLRDAALARSLEQQLLDYNFGWQSIDGSISLSKTVDVVEKHFFGATK